ncbi:MAG: redoxin domain-containing protein, partial [Pseudomonadota bacterium]
MIAAGDKMPDAELTGPDGSPVKLSDYMGKKLVLFFYPKASTPGCIRAEKSFDSV